MFYTMKVKDVVGTITEIYDYLRLLYAKIGTPYCPIHNIPITAQSTKSIVDDIFTHKKGVKIQILVPLAVNQKGTFANLFEKLKEEGFVRIRVNKKNYPLSDKIILDKNKKHNIELIVDRLIIDNKERARFVEAIDVAASYHNGQILATFNDKEEKLYSKNYSCKHCGFAIPELEARLFSFNSPIGACEKCKGLGAIKQASWDLIVPDKSKTVFQGGIMLHRMIDPYNLDYQKLAHLARYYNIKFNKPLEELVEKEISILMHGSDVEIDYTITSKSGNKYTKVEYIEGFAGLIERRYMGSSSQTVRDWLGRFLTEISCEQCRGSRLNEYALAIKINELSINDFAHLSLDDAYSFIHNLKLSKQDEEISKLIIDELNNRLNFLIEVGLEYLTLARNSSTLSGGENQRIRLATQVGSKLTGVTYVLDEPSIGLHQKDNSRLINTLKEMRNLGNTIVIVEHDEETMLESDYLIDIGPGAGEMGGEIVSFGTPKQVMNDPKSLTGRYLSRKEKIDVPKNRRKGNETSIKIIGASENNLNNITVEFPLKTMTVVTGVSGSGKSTLVNEILYKGIKNNLFPKEIVLPGKHKKIEGLDNVDKVIRISQNPIGRTPRSNPATFTGVFDDIRDLFASVPESLARNYQKGRFSFNVIGGRCERCRGDGVIRIIMNFLPDVHVECEECKGQKYNYETLEIKYKGKNIFDVLSMTVEEAYEFFKDHKKIANKLKFLKDVGLNYIALGHSSTILSGGEAQRIKLATHLQKRPTGKTIYLLDEPSTGLHVHDIKKLMKVLNKLVDNGDTVILIEHNLDIIKVCDWIIDLGPEGGKKGGDLIAKGTPEQISRNSNSWTGIFLKDHL